MAADAVKLQAQVMKLQGQLDEVLKERDGANKGADAAGPEYCCARRRKLHVEPKLLHARSKSGR